MASSNVAIVQPAPKENLVIKEVETYQPGEGEVLIRNEAFAVQPLDAKNKKLAYLPLPYPLILGTYIAGTIEAIGPGVSQLTVGEKVVADTQAYITKEARNGGWQKFAISKASSVTPIGGAPIEGAISIAYALVTVVIAFSSALGMPRAGSGVAVSKGEKVLIWGAGGSVGAAAVQYAKVVGYEVIATASERSKASLIANGASQVLDYKSPTIIDDLAAIGPYKYFLCAVSGVDSQQELAKVVAAQGGGKFGSMGSGEATFPNGVERVYKPFEFDLGKPEYAEFAEWWYKIYFPRALTGEIKPPPVELHQGFEKIDEAIEAVLTGSKKKQIVLC